MALKHQVGKTKKILVPDPIRRVIVNGGDYVDALQLAAETYPYLDMIDINTKRIREIANPERVSGKSGQRLFGLEILSPKTTETFIRRIFLFQ